MAIEAIDLAEEKWYVCQSDPGNGNGLEECREKGATIFWFGPIPSLIITDIQDEQQANTIRAMEGGMGMEQVMNSRTNRRNRECFRYAIKRIENMADKKGTPVQVVTSKLMKANKTFEVVSETTLDRIYPSVVGEVGKHIFEMNSMDEVRRKKLEAVFSELDGSRDGTVENAAPKTNTNEDASEMPATEA